MLLSQRSPNEVYKRSPLGVRGRRAQVFQLVMTKYQRVHMEPYGGSFFIATSEKYDFYGGDRQYETEEAARAAAFASYNTVAAGRASAETSGTLIDQVFDSPVNIIQSTGFFMPEGFFPALAVRESWVNRYQAYSYFLEYYLTDRWMQNHQTISQLVRNIEFQVLPTGLWAVTVSVPYDIVLRTYGDITPEQTFSQGVQNIYSVPPYTDSVVRSGALEIDLSASVDHKVLATNFILDSDCPQPPYSTGPLGNGIGFFGSPASVFRRNLVLLHIKPWTVTTNPAPPP